MARNGQEIVSCRRSYRLGGLCVLIGAALVWGVAGEAGARIFPRIQEEFARSRDLILRIRGADRLLAGEPVLERSIRLRNPYVDPMSILQVELLRRWREGGRRDAELERALQSTVRGIARGMQNTG